MAEDPWDIPHEDAIKLAQYLDLENQEMKGVLGTLIGKIQAGYSNAKLRRFINEAGDK